MSSDLLMSTSHKVLQDNHFAEADKQKDAMERITRERDVAVFINMLATTGTGTLLRSLNVRTDAM